MTVMQAEIIDGKAIARRIRGELGEEVSRLGREHGVTPGLAVVLVGEDPASRVYVNSKNKACAEIGIYSEQHSLPAAVPESELLALIERLNGDDRIHGILVQLPLPDHIDEKKVLNAILPDKDVDGFHPVNVGRLMIGEPGFRPCTPYGIQKLLAYSGVETAGAHVVVVGRSNIVGKPIANMLLQKNKEADATVTVCHSRSRDLPALTRQADILIAAIGRPEMIGADMVKPGAVVIDVGVNRVDDPGSGKGYKIVGDVNFAEVAGKCRLITPVPGGVGPMTITMLLYNTVESAKLRAGG
jgi:methylenetetrahydrofolate dehydrogenase (NADP+)/methenyltetrahydrofolate cyclohydrolase